MISQNNLLKHENRNAFVALCEYASQKKWCWGIIFNLDRFAFRTAFSKLIHEQHPDDNSFWPNGKNPSDFTKEINVYKEFRGEYLTKTNMGSQIKLALIVREAKISDIQAVSSFPDWLGYIGLVLYHCPSPKAIKTISDSFLPQFIALMKDDKELCEYFQKKQSNNELLNIKDLEKIENSLKLK